MEKMPDVTIIADILSDRSRMTIIDLLMDGKGHTVNELAKAALIGSQTTSYHLKKLMTLGWISMEKHGRFHYYFLSKHEVAELFEHWGNFSPIQKINHLSQKETYKKLYSGRTCYDHLAGKIGVQLTDWLLNKDYIIKDQETYDLSYAGEQFFINKIGLNIRELRKEKRVFCRMCLDWSERRHHLAGTLGKAFANYLFSQNIIKKDKKNRAVKLTENGRLYLENELEIFLNIE